MTQSMSRWGRKALAWLFLLLAVALQMLSLLVTREENIYSLVLAVLVGVGTVLSLVYAVRLWSDRDSVEGRAFELLARVIPLLNSFREDVRRNAQLEADFGGMLVAYRLVDRGKEEALMQRALGNAQRSTGKVSPSPRALADQLVKDPELEPRFPVEDAERQLLPQCFEILYADRHDLHGCYWAAAGEMEKERLIPVLAKFVEGHEFLIKSGEKFGATRIENVLKRLPRFGLNDVLANLRRTPRAVVDNMTVILDTYQLGKLEDSALREIEVSLIGHVSGFGVESECARRFAEHLVGGSGDGVDRKARLIELLYGERFGLTTKALWPRFRSELVEDLARDLAGTGPLADGPIPFDRGNRESEESVGLILSAMEDFDLRLAERVGARLAKLEHLAEHYAEHLETNGIATPAFPSEGQSRSLLSQVLEFARPRLPATRFDQRLEARHVDLDLLLELGEKWIRQVDQRAATPLSCGLAGSYLTRVGLRPGLAADLAVRAGRAEFKGQVAEILLALIWKHQSRGGRGWVPLGDLAKEWRGWLDEAREEQGGKLTDELLKALRADLRRGVWPTKLPIERALVGLADRVELIVEMLQKVKDGQLTRAELQESGLTDGKVDTEAVKGALRETYHDIQGQMARAQARWEGHLEKRILVLVEEIQKARDPEALKLDGSLGDVTKAIEEASATPLARLTRRLDQLTDVEECLSDEVSGLLRTDQELVREVRHMLEQNITQSRRYMVTFGSHVGPMADLINALAKEPYSYELRPYMPHARVGRLPRGATLDDFYRGFWSDLKKVHEDSEASFDLEDAEIAVQLIARPKGKNVPVVDFN